MAIAGIVLGLVGIGILVLGIVFGLAARTGYSSARIGPTSIERVAGGRVKISA